MHSSVHATENLLFITLLQLIVRNIGQAIPVGVEA
jgi:hypothetical protein